MTKNYITRLLAHNRKQKEKYPEFAQVEKIICNDGFSVSIQASSAHYCRPRETQTEKTNYETVELGFPTETDELILEWVEDADDPTDTVYAQVPVEVVEELLWKHGGVIPAQDPDHQ